MNKADFHLFNAIKKKEEDEDEDEEDVLRPTILWGQQNAFVCWLIKWFSNWSVFELQSLNIVSKISWQ